MEQEGEVTGKDGEAWECHVKIWPIPKAWLFPCEGWPCPSSFHPEASLLQHWGNVAALQLCTEVVNFELQRVDLFFDKINDSIQERFRIRHR